MSLSHRSQSLIDRLPADHPEVPKIKTAMVHALSAAEAFAAKRDELQRSGRLTAQGQREALSEALTKQFARDLRDAQKPIREALGRLQTMRNAVKVRPSADPANVVAALERLEIRTFLAGLPEAERVELVLSTADVRIVEAVITAPRYASGLSEEVFARVETAYQERVFAKEMQEIAALEEVVSEAQAAVAVARNDMQQASGLDPKAFNEVVEPIEMKKGAPWLIHDKRHDGTEQVLLVELGKATYRPATEDEIRDGVFYASLAEYQRARAA